MESADVRIGWLRMLAKVYGRHSGDLYRDILQDIDRLISAAEAERDGRAPSETSTQSSAKASTGGR